MSTFDQLVSDLSRDVRRVQPRDALQFCANWFQSRLEEQRARTRDALASSRPASFSHDLPRELYMDSADTHPFARPPFAHDDALPPRSRPSVSASPFGTLNVPGNALLPDDDVGPHGGPPMFHINGEPAPGSPFAGFDNPSPFGAPAGGGGHGGPGDYLHPPSSTIFARRTSVSAESIDVDGEPSEPLPVFAKSAEQLARIKASIAANFLFRDLDEEQETGVLAAMAEKRVPAGEIVIRQGDIGDYFYVVEGGLLHCFIHPEPLPLAWLTEDAEGTPGERTPLPPPPPPPAKFLQPGYHPEYGKKVAECRPGNSFGELALMYGHPRAATVLAMEPATLWALDRITFRTIILKAAHKRRTMYEQFLTSVPLLTSLEPGERSKIADALVSRVYADGEPVVRQGEMGDTFFFVEEGEAVVTKEQSGDHGELREIEVGVLRKGDYFGGESL